MPLIRDVCRHVRSKNAGPFWVTVDFFFRDAETYFTYRDSPALGPELFQELFGANAAWTKRIPVDNLHIIKVSFVRPQPQGWMHERDMHSGQMFARLMSMEI